MARGPRIEKRPEDYYVVAGAPRPDFAAFGRTVLEEQRARASRAAEPTRAPAAVEPVVVPVAPAPARGAGESVDFDALVESMRQEEAARGLPPLQAEPLLMAPAEPAAAPAAEPITSDGLDRPVADEFQITTQGDVLDSKSGNELLNLLRRMTKDENRQRLIEYIRRRWKNAPPEFLSEAEAIFAEKPSPPAPVEPAPAPAPRAPEPPRTEPRPPALDAVAQAALAVAQEAARVAADEAAAARAEVLAAEDELAAARRRLAEAQARGADETRLRQAAEEARRRAEEAVQLAGQRAAEAERLRADEERLRRDAEARARAEAAKLWKQLQELQKKLEETRAEMKKYKGLFGVRAKDKDKYEELQERSWQLEEDIAELKEDYNERTEEAAELLGVTVSTLKAEIETAAAERKEKAKAGAAAGAGAGAERERAPKGKEEAKWWTWTKGIVKGVVGAGASIVGVKFFYDGVQYIREQSEKRKTSAQVNTLVREVESAMSADVVAAAKRGEHVLFSEEKCNELFNKLNALVKEEKITPEKRDELLIVLRDNILKRVKLNEDEARKQAAKDAGQAVQDYLSEKVHLAQVGREFLNTAFVISGLQVARGVSMLAMGATERLARKWKEQELSVGRGLTRAPEWKEPSRFKTFWKSAWQKTVKDGIKEFGRSIAMQGATAERAKMYGIKGRAADAGKAIGTILRIAGIGYAGYMEWSDERISSALVRAFDTLEERGVHAYSENFVRNLQVYHLWPKGEEGKFEAPETHPAPKVAAAPAAPELPKGPEDMGKELLETKGVLRELVGSGQAELRVTPEGIKIVELNIGSGDNEFDEIQQALRRVVGQEITLAGDHFGDLDADRAEKMIKMLTHNLRGERLPDFMFKGVTQGELDKFSTDIKEIVDWSADGDLLIKDYDRFVRELMPKLEELAPKYEADMLAYVNNTGRRVWNNEIMALRKAGITVDDFDKSALVKEAEHRALLQLARENGIEDAKILRLVSENEGVLAGHMRGVEVSRVVSDLEDTGIFKVTAPDSTEHFLVVNEGELVGVDGTIWRGDDLELSDLPSRTHELITKPHAFPDLFRAEEYGGLVSGGKVHLGTENFEPSLLRKFEDLRPQEFVDRFRTGAALRLGVLRDVSHLKELRALADSMSNHPPQTGDRTFGDYLVNHVDELKLGVGHETVAQSPEIQIGGEV